MRLHVTPGTLVKLHDHTGWTAMIYIADGESDWPEDLPDDALIDTYIAGTAHPLIGRFELDYVDTMGHDGVPRQAVIAEVQERVAVTADGATVWMRRNGEKVVTPNHLVTLYNLATQRVQKLLVEHEQLPVERGWLPAGVKLLSATTGLGAALLGLREGETYEIAVNGATAEVLVLEVAFPVRPRSYETQLSFIRGRGIEDAPAELRDAIEAVIDIANSTYLNDPA